MVCNAICNGVIIFSGGSMVVVFFVVFFTNVIVLPRDVVPYANSILCILVSFISHKPDRKGSWADPFLSSFFIHDITTGGRGPVSFFAGGLTDVRYATDIHRVIKEIYYGYVKYLKWNPTAWNYDECWSGLMYKSHTFLPGCGFVMKLNDLLSHMRKKFGFAPHFPAVWTLELL